MLYAVIALSPTLGGKAAAVDSAAAEAMPGVRRVMSTSSGVVVVADHFWQALKARGALKIAWDPGPNAHLDNAAFWASLDHAAATVPALSAKMTRGDTAHALKDAAKTLSAVYELPLLAHATMEPMNCTADVRADRCELYVGTQVQQGAQAAAADAAGLKAEQVTVHTTLLGGGFGRRLEVDFIPAAVEASKALGMPVKLVWTREDDMTHDFFRPPAREEVSAGVDAHGKLVAFGLHITTPSVTARASPSTLATDPFDSVIEYAQNFPYAVPNYHLSFSRQEIGIDVGYLRSVSHAPNCFAIECFLDELAATLSKDPLELRLALLAGKPRHIAVLQEAARRSGWGRPPPGRFQGLAFMEGYTSHIAQVAEVSVAGGAAQGAQDHVRDRLRPDGQSTHRGVADREWHRVRPIGRALGRHHAQRGPGARNQLQYLPRAALERDARARRASDSKRRGPRRDRRGRRAAGGSRGVQRAVRRDGKAPAAAADRRPVTRLTSAKNYIISTICARARISGQNHLTRHVAPCSHG